MWLTWVGGQSANFTLSYQWWKKTVRSRILYLMCILLGLSLRWVRELGETTWLCLRWMKDNTNNLGACKMGEICKRFNQRKKITIKEKLMNQCWLKWLWVVNVRSKIRKLKRLDGSLSFRYVLNLCV